MKKNKLWISLSITVALAVIILSSLWMPRVEITSSPYALSLSIGRVQAEKLADAGIVYPIETKTDKEKLFAIYSLLEQMRLEHNRVAAIARSDWKKYQGKFQTYAQISKSKFKSLWAEYNKLSESILSKNYTTVQWNVLTPEQRESAYLELLGDRDTAKTTITKATASALTELKAVDLNKLFDSKGIDPLEDFTSASWNNGTPQADPGADLTVEANKVTITTIARRADTFFYSDKGANHFAGDFEHLVEGYIDSGSTIYTHVGIWALSNSTDSWLDIDTANGDAIMVALEDRTTASRVYIYECDSGAAYSAFDTTIPRDTPVFIEVSRDETAGTYGTMYVWACTTAQYDDAGDLVANASLALHTSKKDYRYVYAIMGEITDNANVFTGYMQNLDLQEAAAGPSLTNSPASKDMGILAPSNTFWSKNGASAPSFPLTAGNCTFIITNNGEITIDLSANATNPTGGSGATLIMSNPGSDQIRVSLYKAGDESADNLTLTTTQQAWLSSLAASANVSWDMKLEIGTSSESPPTEKTFHIYLIATAS